MNEFDRFLSENSNKPELIIMHPSIWNGYWSMKRRPKFVSVLFRFLGRRMKSKRLYWIGLSIYWVEGLKKEFSEGTIPEEMYFE